MSLLDAVTARLLADPQFAGPQGKRIGATRRFAALPSTALQTITARRDEHYKGPQASEDGVQLDIWAPTEALASSLRDRAITVLRPAGVFAGIRFRRALITNIRSGAEQGQGPQEAALNARLAPEIYRASIDFLFTYTPA